MSGAPCTPAMRVSAFYQFSRFNDIAALRARLVAVCADAGIKGTILIAPEGVNGTISGNPEAVERVLDHLRQFPGCANLEAKDAWTERVPFHRMKVRLKREIVTMGQPDIDPAQDAGCYVRPQDWNDLIDAPDTILIDTRNDYEVAIGSFAGAIDPQTPTFSDFPEWFRANRQRLFDGKTSPKIAMFCTGGIRCEKATAFLKSEGCTEVYHLQGGILKYLEDVPPDVSRWDGECFVFDQRVAITHGLAQGTYALCYACRRPVSDADRSSPYFSDGISCPQCYKDRDDRQRAGYAERHRQTLLAQSLGEKHIGDSGQGRSGQGR